MQSPIHNIHGWYWHTPIVILQIKDFAKILIKWKTTRKCSCPSRSQRYCQYSIGTKAFFVFATIECEHGIINRTMVTGIHTEQSICNFFIHIFDRFLYSLSTIAFATITQFPGLMSTSRSATRDSRNARRTILKHNRSLYRRIASGIKNLPGQYFLNFLINHKKNRQVKLLVYCIRIRENNAN